MTSGDRAKEMPPAKLPAVVNCQGREWCPGALVRDGLEEFHPRERDKRTTIFSAEKITTVDSGSGHLTNGFDDYPGSVRHHAGLRHAANILLLLFYIHFKVGTPLITCAATHHTQHKVTTSHFPGWSYDNKTTFTNNNNIITMYKQKNTVMSYDNMSRSLATFFMNMLGATVITKMHFF